MADDISSDVHPDICLQQVPFYDIHDSIHDDVNDPIAVLQW